MTSMTVRDMRLQATPGPRPMCSWLIDIIGSRTRVSEVLNRHRPLTVAMIVRLREELGTGNPLSVPAHRNRAMIAP